MYLKLFFLFFPQGVHSANFAVVIANFVIVMMNINIVMGDNKTRSELKTA
jgi:hypothetical protein